MGNSDSSSRGATATASSNGMRATDASAAGTFLHHDASAVTNASAAY